MLTARNLTPAHQADITAPSKDIAMDESYAVGWGSLALINANIAQLKGRSGLGWFLGSLVGGPIVTFLLAVMDRKPTLPSRDAISR